MLGVNSTLLGLNVLRELGEGLEEPENLGGIFCILILTWTKTTTNIKSATPNHHITGLVNV